MPRPTLPDSPRLRVPGGSAVADHPGSTCAVSRSITRDGPSRRRRRAVRRGVPCPILREKGMPDITASLNAEVRKEQLLLPEYRGSASRPHRLPRGAV